MEELASHIEEQLLTTCRTVMGDSLRSVTHFTADDYEQVYLRSDLEADADLSSEVAHETTGFSTRDAYRDTELGDYRYTIRVFENGFITRVVGDDHGVFVTTDGLTLRRSRDLAEAVSSVLD